MSYVNWRTTCKKSHISNLKLFIGIVVIINISLLIYNNKKNTTKDNGSLQNSSNI